ncbi:hypothetical protein [Actinoplanes sp. NPDC026670]|uniref:hypothetical protein n=1 Tax=Actinoplanes sp. NPDC026670 TaxID=3154700 RepID=UPI003410C0CB
MSTRAEAVELCLEALATGRVHGVSPNHDPAHAPFFQTVIGDHGMVRDFGLWEAHFTRWTVQQPWQCQSVVVQAHRMRRPPKWKRLLRELTGFDLVPGDLAVPGSEYIRVVASDSEACIDAETGRLQKISIPAAPPLSRPAPAPNHLRRRVRTVAAGPPSEWPGIPPAAWPHVVATIDNLHRDEPAQRPIWTAYGRWLLDRAASVWPADEWAWRWSRFVLDRPGTVPVGEVTRVCLAALPMTADEAATLPRDWRTRTPDMVRRSRMTLALLRCAADDVPLPPPPRPGVAAWQPLLRHLG